MSLLLLLVEVCCWWLKMFDDDWLRSEDRASTQNGNMLIAYQSDVSPTFNL